MSVILVTTELLNFINLLKYRAVLITTTTTTRFRHHTPYGQILIILNLTALLCPFNHCTSLHPILIKDLLKPMNSMACKIKKCQNNLIFKYNINSYNFLDFKTKIDPICGSCGQIGHLRRSNRLCPLNKNFKTTVASNNLTSIDEASFQNIFAPKNHIDETSFRNIFVPQNTIDEATFLNILAPKNPIDTSTFNNIFANNLPKRTQKKKLQMWK